MASNHSEAGTSSSRVPAAEPSRPSMLTTEERIARREQVWQKHLRGETIEWSEFLARRQPR